MRTSNALIAIMDTSCSGGPVSFSEPRTRPARSSRRSSPASYRGQFAGASSITTWLYSVTTHLCLNRLRNHETRHRLPAASVGGLETQRDPTSEARTWARAFLERVPESLAQIAVHYYVDEMSHDEIARVMGCSRRHIGRLLERLQEQMERERAG